VPPQWIRNWVKGSTSDEAQEYRGIPPSEVASATLKALAKNEYEILVGEAKDLVKGARTNPNRLFST